MVETGTPKRRRRKLYISGWILAISGLCLMLVGGYTYLQTRNFVNSAARAQGTVVELVERSGENGRNYCPVFAFTDKAGKEHKIYSNWGSNPSEFALGDKVTVLYDPRSPEDARLDTFFYLWALTTVFLINGFVYTGVGIAFFYFGGRKNIPSGMGAGTA